MVTFPIPGVAFDLASFSFHVPICRSVAKQSPPARKQNTTVNPIVFVFMAHIETGLRSIVNAFLWLRISAHAGARIAVAPKAFGAISADQALDARTDAGAHESQLRNV